MTRSSQNNNKKKKSAFNEMTAALSDMPGIYFVKFIRTFQKFKYILF